MPKKSRPPVMREVSIEREGKTYRATYTVEKRMVRVSTAHGSKVTQLGNSAPESLALVLLLELIREGQA
jgi:hypothetical protein